jgi:hypothetical protein
VVWLVLGVAAACSGELGPGAAGPSTGAGGTRGVGGGGGSGDVPSIPPGATPSDECGPSVENCYQQSVGPGANEPFPMPADPGDEGGGTGGQGAGGTATSLGGSGTGGLGSGGAGKGGATTTQTSGQTTTSSSGESTTTPTNGGVFATGVTLDGLGHVTLVPKKALTDYLWVADDTSYGVGLVSKIRTKPFPKAPTYREVARYATVTCRSNPTLGSTELARLGKEPAAALCTDGEKGCCTLDETTKGPNGKHQPVNLVANRPSRTAVDDNGDIWVANRGFDRQGSVTKIAGTHDRCIDRNGDGVLQTSSDANGDGIITTDCDGDQLPDDASTVCTDGGATEFYGLDDECVLFTVNVGAPGDIVRALALTPPEKASELGSQQVGSDAWVGTWKDGTFRRVNGDTGRIEETVALGGGQAWARGVPPHPYGAAVDEDGILWTPNVGEEHLFYFDTKHPARRGMVDAALGGTGFYGIAVDGYVPPGGKKRRQQIWLGEVGSSGAYRYRPLRGQGIVGLGEGKWARAEFEGEGAVKQGRGIAVDDRKPKSFAWVALDGGAIGRIPIDLPDHVSMLVASDHVFPTGQSGTLGVGIAGDLDVWAVNQGSSSATHFSVDAKGNVQGAPDTVPLDDKPGAEPDFCPLGPLGNCKPQPYTYSDFTGYGYATFSHASGYYGYVQKGCGAGKLTRWYKVLYDADVPKDASVTVSARAAGHAADIQDAELTGEYTSSPAELLAPPGPLSPNPAPYLEVLFSLSMEGSMAPTLKGFTIVFACEDAP